MKHTKRAAVDCLIVMLSAFTATAAIADDLKIPNTFVPGTAATAAAVNDNFSATSTAVNSKQNKVAGSCSVGQAIRAINADGTVVCETGLATTASLLNYMPVGPQNNVPQALVNLGGWTTCFTEPYNASTSVINTVLTSCNKANLMLACLQTGTDTYTLLAQAPRADVTFVTPNDATTTHVANGTAWYFSVGFSWGFAKPGDATSKGQCDTATGTNPEQRLCWHTLGAGGALSGGYRCGATTSLNASAAWQRVILHRD